ncbi:hypothetical protein HU200_018906 [Digitaria exilis]|uniref:Uncharacterized protein n=1 Tax=Digitaria exilis TaxID=1010633 RepID=A0A835F3S4_9POAL|nr:hypothetical protein HU200_018906 [Digitaria exilis]
MVVSASNSSRLRELVVDGCSFSIELRALPMLERLTCLTNTMELQFSDVVPLLRHVSLAFSEQSDLEHDEISWTAFKFSHLRLQEVVVAGFRQMWRQIFLVRKARTSGTARACGTSATTGSFDGYATLVRVAFRDGRVVGAHRQVDSDAYKAARAHGEVRHREFSEVPEPVSLVSRLTGLALWSPITDNANTAVAAFSPSATGVSSAPPRPCRAVSSSTRTRSTRSESLGTRTSSVGWSTRRTRS